jgi:exosortase H (IPTLxxWG-CTERM-specific)
MDKPSRPAASAGPPPGQCAAPAAATRPGMWRFAALFAVFILVGFGLLTAPFAEPAVTAFSGSLVNVSGALIDVCGGHALVNGPILSDPTGGFAIEMKNGCNGAHVMILLWSALLAFPASWPLKLKGLLAGSLAIHGVNLARFISLFYLGQYDRAWFDFAHYYLWESLIVMDAMVIFWLWVNLVFRSGAGQNASG